MDTFSIVTVIAIILFARLGMRLVKKYLKMQKNNRKNESESSENS